MRSTKVALFVLAGGLAVTLFASLHRDRVGLIDGERVIVIGSNAGNESAPAWSHNLKANPAADIEIRGDRRSVRARVAEGEERERIWTAQKQRYSGFADYEEKTKGIRDIPVIVLEPR